MVQFPEQVISLLSATAVILVPGRIETDFRLKHTVPVFIGFVPMATGMAFYFMNSQLHRS